MHEVGDFVTLTMNYGRAPANRLRRQLATSVLANLEKGEDEMTQEFRDMSLFRVAQIAKALP